MTREHKLALILGFSVVLVVGVLISDHFSGATVAQLEDLTGETVETIAATDARGPNRPIDKARADRSPEMTGPRAGGALPGGFTIDGEPGAPTVIADRPVFDSGREALLNELQQTWRKAQDSIRSQTHGAVPAVALDGGVSGPVAVTARLPEPTRVATGSAPGKSAADGSIPTKRRRVAEDDSLWSIAQQEYGDGALYTKLAAFNRDRVGEGGSIRVGVVLRIPPRRALTGERPAAHKKKIASNHSAPPKTYTVQPGDTLGDIAQRLLGSSKRWTEIVELNGIDDPDVVPVGTTLKLPAAPR